MAWVQRCLLSYIIVAVTIYVSNVITVNVTNIVSTLFAIHLFSLVFLFLWGQTAHIHHNMTLALAAMDEVTEALDLKVQICHQFHQFTEKRKKYYIAKRKQKKQAINHHFSTYTFESKYWCSTHCINNFIVISTACRIYPQEDLLIICLSMI